jgi:signal transduction histidine kinase/ActR/RegA family two-component response regulator
MHAARLVAAIWSAVTMLVIATAAATGWLIERGERDAIGEAELRVQRFAAGAEAALNRTMIGVDLLLADMGELIAPDGRFERAAAERRLEAAEHRDLTYRDLIVLDNEGNVVASATEQSARLGVPLPRKFIHDTLTQPSPKLAISPPVRNFATSEQAIYFARPFTIGEGPRMLAIAEVPVDILARILAQSIQIPGLEVTLERENGELLASVPPNDAQLGALLATALPMRALSGTAMHMPGRLNGAPSIVAARPALHPSIRLTAGIPKDAALADWRQTRNQVLSVAVALIAMLLGAGYAAHWQLGRLSRARLELARAKNIMDRALASMGDGFLLCDSQDCVVAWNARYIEMFPSVRMVIGVGIDFRTIAEASAATIAPDPNRSAERLAWVEARLAQHRSGDGTFEQPLADGSVIHVVERRTLDGGTVSVMRDITKAERELARAKAAAEASNEAKSQFLAAMSHEIRTPLNGVLGMNSLLMQTQLSEQQLGYVRTIRSSGNALLALINDILDLSRVEAGRLELVLAEFDPRRLVDEVAASVATRAHEKGLAFKVRYQSGLPAVLVGDEGRMRQVLFNLIGNAVKFTEQGSVQVQVDYREIGHDRVLLEVAVEDTGIGIDQAALPSLFERFRQADSGISRRYGGSGLGLAICRGLLDLMGGTIAVETEVGAGSTFRISVELQRGQSSQIIGAESRFEPDRSMEGGLRILVAEDNEINQLVICAMLAQLGHSSDLARDGHEVLAKVQAAAYDLVLMDIQMPNLDGLAAARAIRALDGPTSQIPIIALTANTMVEDRQTYLEAGMDDHVAKPIDIKRLARAIGGVVELQRQSQY